MFKRIEIQSLDDGTRTTEITSIVVVGNDIYAAGFRQNIGNTAPNTVYWKNGEKVVLIQMERKMRWFNRFY